MCGVGITTSDMYKAHRYLKRNTDTGLDRPTRQVVQTYCGAYCGAYVVIAVFLKSQNTLEGSTMLSS